MNPDKKMSKRQMMREKRERQARTQRLGVIGIIVVGALLVAFALIYPSVKPVGTVVTKDPGNHPMANDNAMGDPNAPIKIEEFSDFQCPYCARFHEETEWQIANSYVTDGTVVLSPRLQPKRHIVQATKINTGSITISYSPIRPARTWALIPTVACRPLPRRCPWI